MVIMLQTSEAFIQEDYLFFLLKFLPYLLQRNLEIRKKKKRDLMARL